MGWWYLRLSAKILALLRLSANFFQLRLTKKLKINFSCFKKLNIKGAMSPHTHARANENKLEKDGPTFSSSVGDFGRLFLSV